MFSGLQRNFLAQYQVGENTGLLHCNQRVFVVANNFRLVLNATFLSAFWSAVVLPRKKRKVLEDLFFGTVRIRRIGKFGDLGAAVVFEKQKYNTNVVQFSVFFWNFL